MIKEIAEEIGKVTFNDCARHPLQSWEWGEARRKTGVEAVRLGEYENGTLKNVFTMTVHPLPKLPWKIGYIPRSVLPSAELTEYLKDYGNKNKLIFIKIEPYVFSSDRQMRPKDYNHSSHPLFPDWTQILDLAPDEDILLKNMKPKTRYNIRLAQKKGVAVREESTDDGFGKFSRLYFETCRRQNYRGHTPEYHRTIWNNLKNGISRILVAYYGNEPLAAYELFHFKDRFYYPYGGSSESHRNLMAANLLMWEAVKLGKRLGAREFDMWGSLPAGYDQKDPWAGFTRFKEGYGTRFSQFIGSYDLVINPLLYRLYSSVYSLRQKVI